MNKQFNPSRLKLARVRRKLTLKALAELVDLTPRRVAEYEKDYCASTPPEKLIEAYEEALQYPKNFFLKETDVELVEPESVSFRSLKSMKASNQHAAIGAGSLGLMLSEYLESRFNLPPVDLPDLRGLEPEAAAEELRELWGLGSHSINNMVHLLEKHGVKVFSLAENTQTVDAFSFWKEDKAFVFLNTQKSGERSRMDAAHELGHLVLHRHGIPQGKDVEQEADRFAAFFLMPRRTVLSIADRSLTVDDIIRLKSLWKTSAFSVIMQLRSIDAITEWHHRSLIIEASKRGLRTKEIEGIERETTKLLDMLLEQLKNDGISLKDLARELALPLEELTNLTFKFGVISNDKSKNDTKGTKPHLYIVK